MSDDLERLVADLRDAGDYFQLKARGLVEKHGTELRDEIRRLAPRRFLPHYAETITVETGVDRSTGTVWAEAGAEARGQGNLGGILEHGTSKTPPHAHHGPGLDRQAPRFEDALADILDPLRGRR